MKNSRQNAIKLFYSCFAIYTTLINYFPISGSINQNHKITLFMKESRKDTCIIWSIKNPNKGKTRFMKNSRQDAIKLCPSVLLYIPL